MHGKRPFVVYHLLLSEGTTEFNIFAYLTKNKFRTAFSASSVKFSDKVEIIKNGNQVVSQGILNGVGSLGHFNSNYNAIKAKYPREKLFFIIDKDLDDSVDIGNIIITSGDLVQFLEYNSEHLLLKLAGKNPLEPTDFNNLKDFRDYTKAEFQNKFGMKTCELKDVDFDTIFNNLTDDQIKNELSELFGTII